MGKKKSFNTACYKRCDCKECESLAKDLQHKYKREKAKPIVQNGYYEDDYWEDEVGFEEAYKDLMDTLTSLQDNKGKKVELVYHKATSEVSIYIDDVWSDYADI